MTNDIIMIGRAMLVIFMGRPLAFGALPRFYKIGLTQDYCFQVNPDITLFLCFMDLSGD